MPLFPPSSTTPITGIPRNRRKFFGTYRPRISATDYEAIRNALNAVFDKQQAFTSSHIPGPKWDKGPYAPILVACNGNERNAGRLFGLLFWEVAVLREPDNWRFYKSEVESDEIQGTTYIPET
jgi:hypothetical protein